MQRDWRDDRIAELEAELAAKDVVIAAQAARIAEQDRRIGELEKRLAQLAEQLGQNSRNSHRPPSSDTPEERRKRKNQEKKARQERKHGGQPGHQGAHRELVPPEKVTKFVDLFPAECGPASIVDRHSTVWRTPAMNPECATQDGAGEHG